MSLISKKDKRSRAQLSGTRLSIIKLLSNLYFAVLMFSFFNPQQIIAQKKSEKKILIIVSSQDKKAEPDIVAGFWFPELTHPARIFGQAGYDIDIASPRGGMAPFDGFDLKDPDTRWFWTNPYYRDKLGNTRKLSEINPNEYFAVVLIGGHGPMFDFAYNKELQNLIRKIYQNNGIVSAVCHGPAGFVDLKLDNGQYILKNRRITAFSNAEETSRDYNKFVPFELESKLKENGAIYEKSDQLFGVKVCVDSRIVTGQNPASAHEFGEAVVAEIKKTQQK